LLHLTGRVFIHPVQLDALVLDVLLHLSRLVVAQGGLLLAQLFDERLDLLLLLVDVGLKPVSGFGQVLVVFLADLGRLPDKLGVEDADLDGCALLRQGR